MLSKIENIYKIENILVYIARWTSVISLTPRAIIVYTARWMSGISEEVYDMGSYRTRRQPSVIRAHIVHFFTYLMSPRAVYSLYHDNYSTRLLVA